jgi:hypothetical protein
MENVDKKVTELFDFSKQLLLQNLFTKDFITYLTAWPGLPAAMEIYVNDINEKLNFLGAPPITVEQAIEQMKNAPDDLGKKGV